MKYYLYISPSKIQMLYEQLPVKLRRKLSVELSIDLKFIGTAIKKDTWERYSRQHSTTSLSSRATAKERTNEFHSHQGTKVLCWNRVPWIFFYLFQLKPTTIGVDKEGEHPFLLDQVKQIGFDPQPLLPLKQQILDQIAVLERELAALRALAQQLPD